MAQVDHAYDNGQELLTCTAACGDDAVVSASMWRLHTVSMRAGYRPDALITFMMIEASQRSWLQ
jgi:hypothetical protein